MFHVGHGNINDKHSWSVPFQPDKVIDYVLPESTGGQLTREEALFSNRSKVGLPRGAAWEIADVQDGAYADGRIAAEGIRHHGLQRHHLELRADFPMQHFTSVNNSLSILMTRVLPVPGPPWSNNANGSP